MNANRVFFPQQTLDQWLEQGCAALVGDELMLGPDGRRFRLSSALRFVEEVGGGGDPHALIGKVKAVDEVQALAGEHCADSVIIGDSAYQVVEGFLGELLPAVRTRNSARPGAKGNRGASGRASNRPRSRASLAPVDPNDPLARLLEQL